MMMFVDISRQFSRKKKAVIRYTKKLTFRKLLTVYTDIKLFDLIILFS